MPSASSSVAVSVSASQLIKSVTLFVFKKVTAIVCVFYEKHRLKIQKPLMEFLLFHGIPTYELRR